MRWWREKQGLSLTQVGDFLGVTRSTVCNFESGRRRIDETYAQDLDQRYGTGELMQSLLFYARLAHDPDWHVTFTGYELEASVIRIYHGQLVPGPLQTERTIRALVSAGRNVKDIEGMVKARLARQEAILGRENPIYIWVLLDENVLDRLTGGPEVLREQFAHLHELSLSANIGIRIIASTAGAHLGGDGSMRLVSLDGRDVVYMGAQRGGRLIESPVEVREVALDWELISQKALSDDGSRALILRKMEALG
jgi:transcriptional regulator with XRE-family HTH domain